MALRKALLRPEKVKRQRGQITNTHGVGLANVPVSNGQAIVLSDQNGCFSLTIDAQRHTHVFVTVPAGWSANNGFYRTLKQWRGGQTTFELKKKRPNKNKSICFSAITDLHYGQFPPAGPSATRLLRKELSHVQSQSPHSQFIIAAGDLTEHGHRSDLQTIRHLFDKLDTPIFSLFGGGHDGLAERKLQADKPWARHYLETMGPIWYSFDWGTFHFAAFANEDAYFMQPMLQAKSRWLRADLKLAQQRGLSSIVITHCPPTMRWARQLEALNVKLVLTGHFHTLRTYMLGEMRVLTFPCLMRGGIDMMPRGFLEFHAQQGKMIQYRYRVLSTAFNKRTSTVSKKGLLWSRKLSGYFHRTQPVMDTDHKMYVVCSNDLRGGDEGSIVCLDARNGRILWTVSTPHAVKSPITLHHDRVFVNTQVGELLCLDKHDGRTIWSRCLKQWPDRWLHAPPVVAGKVVIAGHSRGGIEAFTISRGRRAWQLNTDRPAFINGMGDSWPSDVAPVAVGDDCILPIFREKIICLCSATAEVRWEHDINYRYYMPGPLQWHSSIWLPNAQPHENIVRLDVDTGKVLARSKARGVVVRWSVTQNALLCVVLDQWINGRGYLQCRSAQSGRLKWQQPLGRDTAHAYAYYAQDGPNCLATPVVFNEKVFAACTDGRLRQFDLTTGRRIATLDMGSPMFNSPLFAEDRLWIALWSGHLDCRKLAR